MSPSEPDASDVAAAAFAGLGHDMRNALTIIWGRTHLLQRAVHHDATLTEAQRTPFLRDLAAIDIAVAVLVAVLVDLEGQDRTNVVPDVPDVPAAPSPDSR